MITVNGFLSGCSTTKSTKETRKIKAGVSGNNVAKTNTITHKSNIPPRAINTKNISADALVKFAESLKGVKYKYGSAKIEEGFDCSGFISYVFNHFDIQVPRSSLEFTNAGTTVSLEESKKGDLILFTGTDTTGWVVGHMGIITQNNQGIIQFIHSASGNNKGVMESGMSKYFITRFVKVIRVFEQD
jgi:cell wall-associated NlpC family hydrolase